MKKGEDPDIRIPGAEFSGTTESPKVYNGNVIVDITDVASISNAIIKGNLIITGTVSEDIIISNIKVEGNLDLSAVKGDSDNSFENIEVTGETNI